MRDTFTSVNDGNERNIFSKNTVKVERLDKVCLKSVHKLASIYANFSWLQDAGRKGVKSMQEIFCNEVTDFCN